jgi:hypothetical protein
LGSYNCWYENANLNIHEPTLHAARLNVIGWRCFSSARRRVIHRVITCNYFCQPTENALRRQFGGSISALLDFTLLLNLFLHQSSEKRAEMRMSDKKPDVRAGKLFNVYV